MYVMSKNTCTWLAVLFCYQRRQRKRISRLLLVNATAIPLIVYYQLLPTLDSLLLVLAVMLLALFLSMQRLMISIQQPKAEILDGWWEQLLDVIDNVPRANEEILANLCGSIVRGERSEIKIALGQLENADWLLNHDVVFWIYQSQL